MHVNYINTKYIVAAAVDTFELRCFIEDGTSKKNLYDYRIESED